MNVEEATRLKEKLDNVLQSVDEYGKQSEQFAKARSGLVETLGFMNKTNTSLEQLLTSCDSYLQKASEVVNDEYFEKIQNTINDINATATLIQKCSENTSTESEKLIESSQAQLTALEESLSKNIQISVEKVRSTAELLQVCAKQAADNAKDLVESSNNEIFVWTEKLGHTCDSLIQESEQLNESYKKILEAQNKIEADLTEIQNNDKNGFEEIGKTVRSTAELLQVCVKQAADNTKGLVESSNNEIFIWTEKLKNTCDSLIQESEKLNESYKKIIEAQNKIENNLIEIQNNEKNGFEEIKSLIGKNEQARQKKNKIFCIVGGIAFAIIVGLLIINIFV